MLAVEQSRSDWRDFDRVFSLLLLLLPQGGALTPHAAAHVDPPIGWDSSSDITQAVVYLPPLSKLQDCRTIICCVTPDTGGWGTEKNIGASERPLLPYLRPTLHVGGFCFGRIAIWRHVGLVGVGFGRPHGGHVNLCCARCCGKIQKPATPRCGGGVVRGG